MMTIAFARIESAPRKELESIRSLTNLRAKIVPDKWLAPPIRCTRGFPDVVSALNFYSDLGTEPTMLRVLCREKARAPGAWPICFEIHCIIK